MKKVSVIIPVYNGSKYLYQCIESVINQDYKNLEIIVVDDNSSDNSISIIKKFKDRRIKLIKLNNHLGVSKARNRGIDEASGELICFIDSDDYWYLDKISKQVRFILDNDYKFIYGSYLYLKNNHTHIAKVPKMITYNEALKNTTIFTSTVMFNMKYLNKKDIYMPDIKLGQDTACWWKILKSGVTAYGMSDILSVYRISGESLSSNKLKAIKRTWNLYRLEDISYLRKIYCFICYLFNAIIRRLF